MHDIDIQSITLEQVSWLRELLKKDYEVIEKLREISSDMEKLLRNAHPSAERDINSQTRALGEMISVLEKRIPIVENAIQAAETVVKQ